MVYKILRELVLHVNPDGSKCGACGRLKRNTYRVTFDTNSPRTCAEAVICSDCQPQMIRRVKGLLSVRVRVPLAITAARAQEEGDA